MKIKEISASYGRKKSDGDYGSRDVFFSLTAEVGPEESAQEAQQELFNICHQMVVDQYSAGGKSPEAETIPAWRQKLNEGLAERNSNYGEENGPKGSQFNDERVESISGQQ